MSKMSNVCQHLSVWGAGDVSSGIWGAIGKSWTSLLSQAPSDQGRSGICDIGCGQLSQKGQFLAEIVADSCHVLPKDSLQDPAAGHERSFDDKQGSSGRRDAPIMLAVTKRTPLGLKTDKNGIFCQKNIFCLLPAGNQTLQWAGGGGSVRGVRTDIRLEFGRPNIGGLHPSLVQFEHKV